MWGRNSSALMSNYQLYQQALTSAGHGTPLWEPSSTTSQTALRIGDVGYLRFGTFVRLFNVTLPSGHRENENGEPENYVPLVVHPTEWHRTVIPKGIIASSGIQVSSLQQDDSPHVSFRCTDKIGAVIMAEDDVIREDVVNLGPFADYAATHSHTWIRFARHTLMREVALHELILLTGCDLTRGRYSVTVFNGAHTSKRPGHGASFQLARPGSGTRLCPNPEAISYFQHNYGPSSSMRSVTPCLFIRGFKLLDRHVERMEDEEADRNEIEDSCGTAQSRGPLDAILRYLCDKSDADMAITHDLDLIRLLHKDKVSWDYNYVLKRLRKGRPSFISEGPVASLI
ncbi:hypothetical protein JB92DRAFT_1322811 [Gautieria morchelliformis]|nr:hypothetical protein JB92DRAFT_1322811 [Gautieria morchelliformis]